MICQLLIVSARDLGKVLYEARGLTRYGGMPIYLPRMIT